MKKTLITGFFIGLALISKAQNGGQANENGTSKIEYLGIAPNGQAIVKLTNKQSCSSGMRLTYSGSQSTKIIAALGSDTFMLTRDGDECTARAKPLTNCGGANMGQVEISICPVQVLPIKFTCIKARKISAGVFEIEFEASEVDGSNQFNIQLSNDGLTFKTVSVILKNEIRANQIYKIKIVL